MEKALEALHIAAAALKLHSYEHVSVDNDNDSGEIFFSVEGRTFMLKLSEVEQ
jgi:hypothetical protein